MWGWQAVPMHGVKEEKGGMEVSGGGESGFQMFGPRGGRGANDGESSSGGPGPYRAPSDPTSNTSKSSFPSSGGRALGGGSTGDGGLLSRGKKSNPPKTPEEKAALLERAAERRRQQQQQSEEEGVSAV